MYRCYKAMVSDDMTTDFVPSKGSLGGEEEAHPHADLGINHLRLPKAQFHNCPYRERVDLVHIATFSAQVTHGSRDPCSRLKLDNLCFSGEWVAGIVAAFHIQ